MLESVIGPYLILGTLAVQELSWLGESAKPLRELSPEESDPTKRPNQLAYWYTQLNLIAFKTPPFRHHTALHPILYSEVGCNILFRLGNRITQG
jgi:hypothetical protein